MSLKSRFRFPLAILLACAMVTATARQADAQSQNKTAMTDEVSYTNDIRPIVKNFCTTCHAGNTPEGEFVLTSYDDVRKHVEKGELLKRINDADDPMPQNGLMPTYMRRLFKVWAQQGYIHAGKAKPAGSGQQIQEYQPPTIVPVDINKQGFEMLGYMQGHWVGSMNLLGVDYDWMAFDYRPIAPSHIHGIFEGGSIGNLFTSFFVANFKGKMTLMARNGGMLNGIYRTSYFVLDQVKYGNDWGYYRFVDAYGGKEIMYMELTFRGDSLDFNAFTSRFGLTEAKKHMAFKGKRMHADLAKNAAAKLGFPKNVVDYDFSKGLPKPAWAKEYPHTSASYITEARTTDLVALGKAAKDPRRIDQMPYLSQLSVHVKRNPTIAGKKLLVYLSRDALVDANGNFITQGGYMREDLLNTLLSFPELGATESDFTFTYLHPGKYYLTVVADMDGDGYPSPGDVTHTRRTVVVKSTSNQKVSITDMNAKN